MRKQKDTTYGTVISFRLPNRIVSKLAKRVRSIGSSEIQTPNQLARQFTLRAILGVSGGRRKTIPAHN